MRLSIYTDGGSKGNPGPAAIGVAIYEGDRGKNPGTTKLDNELFRYREDIGTGTNNEAEYEAVVRALELVLGKIDENKPDIDIEKLEKIDFYSDSELLVKQLNGIYKVKKSHIRDFVFKIRVLESELRIPVLYQHIRREENVLADALVNDDA